MKIERCEIWSPTGMPVVPNNTRHYGIGGLSAARCGAESAEVLT
ncbi:MAG: hypothetical protein ABIG11_02970 [bacterium]